MQRLILRQTSLMAIILLALQALNGTAHAAGVTCPQPTAGSAVEKAIWRGGTPSDAAFAKLSSSDQQHAIEFMTNTFVCSLGDNGSKIFGGQLIWLAQPNHAPGAAAFSFVNLLNKAGVGSAEEYYQRLPAEVQKSALAKVADFALTQNVPVGLAFLADQKFDFTNLFLENTKNCNANALFKLRLLSRSDKYRDLTDLKTGENLNEIVAERIDNERRFREHNGDEVTDNQLQQCKLAQTILSADIEQLRNRENFKKDAKFASVLNYGSHREKDLGDLIALSRGNHISPSTALLSSAQ